MDFPIVTLHRGRARPFWAGNPLVFSGAIESVAGGPAPGSLVEVRDAEGRPIGHGFFNPASQYRVRIVRLERASEPPPEPAAILASRLAAARDLRATIGLPSADTDAWRLVNSEGDGLSGLTVDVFGDCAVILASALWVETWRDAVDSAVRAAVPHVTTVVHRVSAQVQGQEGMSAAPPAAEVATVRVRESGIVFEIDPTKGQKTGFYLDQRTNRLLVRSLAAGRRVLDLYCFTGGFALAAAAGGAAEVLGIDTSAPAIDVARRNAAANGLVSARFDVGDAVDALAAGGGWDMVICDPPKLARSRNDLEAALPRYRRISRDAVAVVRPGGVLVTCSCSSAMRRDAFVEVVRDAAAEAGRRLAITHVLGAAPDHPVHPAFPEGEYLKCVVGVAS